MTFFWQIIVILSERVPLPLKTTIFWQIIDNQDRSALRFLRSNFLPIICQIQVNFMPRSSQYWEDWHSWRRKTFYCQIIVIFTNEEQLTKRRHFFDRWLASKVKIQYSVVFCHFQTIRHNWQRKTTFSWQGNTILVKGKQLTRSSRVLLQTKKRGGKEPLFVGHMGSGKCSWSWERDMEILTSNLYRIREGFGIISPPSYVQ